MLGEQARTKDAAELRAAAAGPIQGLALAFDGKALRVAPLHFQ